jgi:RNA-binding protein
MPLTGKQRRHLRSLAHHLDPVVLVGASGLTGAVVRQVSEALETHELIKVRFGEGADPGAREAAPDLAERTRAELAQVIGHIAVLYRRRKEKPEITLPD